MRWLACALLLGAFVPGCSLPPADDAIGAQGTATDDSLPGIVLAANVTRLDDGRWHLWAEGSNDGSRTFYVDTGCDSPFRFEARAEGGQPYGEVRCLAYTVPVPFQPGESVQAERTIDPDDMDWSGQVRFDVTFQAHDSRDGPIVGSMTVVLEP